MNEQEAIEQLSSEYLVSVTGTETPARVRYHNEALDTAIAALKEVQEYHATGHTPRMVRELRRGYVDAHKTAVRYATQLDEYHDLGGFEACKAAVERTRWIPVSERMPEERDSIFAKFKGTDKWKTGMCEKISETVIVTVCSNDGSHRTTTAHTSNGRWKVDTFLGGEKVVAWKRLPEPYHIADASKKVGDSE